MGRQRTRMALIIFSFVLMPVTFAYISCPIIIDGASKGIITGGMIVFILIFASSLFFWGGSGVDGSARLEGFKKFTFM